MGAREQLGRALFGLCLRNFVRGGRAKKLRAQAGEVLIALKLPRARRPSSRLAAGGTQAALAAVPLRAESVVLQHPISRFADDMSMLLKASRSRLHSEYAKVAQEARLLGIRKMASDPKVWNLGLAEEQADTLGALLGHLWGAPFQGGARAGPQTVAQELSAGLRAVWDRALPPGKTLEETLQAAWRKLKEAREADPDLLVGDFLRDELFDPWRGRFMTLLHKEEGLRTRLHLATGLKVDKPAGSDPRFLLELKAGEVPFHVGLDIDHAEQRLADAVQQALAKDSPALLRPIVQGSSLQLASPAENRVLFEFLRRRNRVAEQMRTSSAALMTAEDEAELLTALERELQALDAWQEWNRTG
jgi:hypothetical protein